MVQWVVRYHVSPGAWWRAFQLHVLWRPFSAAVLVENWAGWIAAGAALVGLLALVRRTGEWVALAGSRRGRTAADPVVAYAAGLGAVALAMLGAGLCGLLAVPSVPWGTVVLAAIGLADLAVRPRAWGRLGAALDPRPALAPLGPPARAAAVLLTAVTAAHLLGIEDSWDAMTYHLRLPSFYLIRHKVFDVTHHISTTYPANGEMLFTLARGAGGDPLARFLNAFTGLLGLAVVGRVGTALGVTCSLPVALVAWSPLFALLLTRNYLDLLTLLWGGCAWLGMISWVRRGARLPLLAAGAAAGLAMGTKYTAVLLVPAMAVAAWPGRRRVWAPAAIAAGLVLLPWLLRNELIRGNPVHPFLAGRWGLPQARPSDLALPFEHADAGGRVLASGWGGRFEALLFNDGRMQGPLAPALACGLPLLLLGSGVVPTGLLAAAGIFIGGWLVLAPDIRYLAPLLPLLAGLLALAATRRGTAEGLGRRGLLEAGWVVAALYAAGYQWVNYAPAAMPLGLESRREKLALALPPHPFLADAADAIHHLTAPTDRVLLVSHFNSYYIERECTTDFHFDRALATRIVRTGGTPDGIARELRRRGIRWILGCGGLALGYAHIPGYFDAGPGGWAAWKRMLAERGVAEWQTDGFVLYRIGARHAPRVLPALPPLDAVDFNSPLVADTGGASARRAERLAARREYAAAAVAWREALARGADTPEIRFGLARAQVALNRPGEGYREALCGLAANPRSAWGHALVAVLLEGAGHRVEALAAIRRAIVLDPGEPDYRRLGASMGISPVRR